MDKRRREDLQAVFIRVCRDSGFRLDYARAAQLAAKVLGAHPMDIWIALPSLDVMQQIAEGSHPAAHRSAPARAADCNDTGGLDG